MIFPPHIFRAWLFDGNSQTLVIVRSLIWQKFASNTALWIVNNPMFVMQTDTGMPEASEISNILSSGRWVSAECFANNWRYDLNRDENSHQTKLIEIQCQHGNANGFNFNQTHLYKWMIHCPWQSLVAAALRESEWRQILTDWVGNDFPSHWVYLPGTF